MTELDMEKERREFEAWQSEGGADLTRAIGCQQNYSDLETNCEWYGWLAAKRAAHSCVEPVMIPAQWLTPGAVVPITAETVRVLLDAVRSAPPSTDAEGSEIYEALKSSVRAAELALFVIRKQGVMPNSSWESGFDKDMEKARAAIAAKEAT